MKQFFQTIANANKAPIVRALAFICIALINVLLISVFITYFRIKANLHNPLIPKALVDYSFQPYALKGLILSFGLPILLLLKYMKQNVLVIVGTVTILVTYAFTNHFIDWY